MPDTYRIPNPNMQCDDCGVKGTTYMHAGFLVPIGLVGHFCQNCIDVRIGNTSGPISPLGKTSYIKRCKGKYVLLRFPDTCRSEDVVKSPTTFDIATNLELALRCSVGHMQGTINVCEFQWNEGLDDQLIDILLNEFRETFPSLAITGDEVSFIGKCQF